MMQLCQVQLLQGDIFNGLALPLGMDGLSFRQSKQALEVWQRASARGASVSVMQQDIARTCKLLDPEAVLEGFTEDGLFSIDVCLFWQGRCGGRGWGWG